jgi:GNAT superfamily N-acetyltransferase
VEIRELDLADDGVIRDVYALESRSATLGREGMPHWSEQEFTGAHRSPDSGERQVPFGAYDGDRLLGYCVAWFPLLDNLDKCWFDLHVDPPARRHGVGRALLGELERRAEADRRSILLTDSKIPTSERVTHPYRLFAEACGYELSNVEVVRHLPLPVPEERLRGWADEAAERHQGYRVETYVDEFPDELAESLCVLLGQLAVDAPTGLVDFEEETMTPERLKERYVTVAAMGRSLFETVAISPDGVVAAQSTLAVATGDGPDVFQWGTFVHREHRGHRLGLAVKAANIRAVQEAHPDKLRITTQNAETNDYMVSINKQMGFEAVEDSAEWIKHL